VCLYVLAPKPIVGLVLLDIFIKTGENEPTTVEHKVNYIFTKVDLLKFLYRHKKY
jgi:hypothetical protein